MRDYNREMGRTVPHLGIDDAHASVESPLVFLDTNVILEYLRGDRPTAELFSAESDHRVRFAVNPIVLQELLLISDPSVRPELERIRGHLRVLPIDFTKAEAIIPRARGLKERPSHSNDVLIISSADNCDFLVTRNTGLKALVAADRPEVVTPEELVTRLRAA